MDKHNRDDKKNNKDSKKTASKMPQHKPEKNTADKAGNKKV